MRKKILIITLCIVMVAAGIAAYVITQYSTPTSIERDGLMQVTRSINGIPVLEIYEDNEKDKPLVLVSHGFAGSKESMNEDGKMDELAKMGYYVVALDNRMHGERPGASFKVEAVKSMGKINLVMVRTAIKETADDVKRLVDFYSYEEQIDENRIGMIGVSMGGFVTYRAMTIEDRIKVAVPFISSPFWDDIPGDLPKELEIETENLEVYSNEYSPGNQVEKFYPCAIFGQVGDSDEHFKVERVQDFYGALEKYYEKTPDKLKLKVYPNVGHEVTDEMWKNGLEWFEEYL